MNIQQTVKELTLSEKAGLTSGATWWLTKGVERLNVPQVFMADGPHGLRKSDNASGASGEPAVCFPAACLTAASFDRELLREMGRELARQAAACAVDIILGPAVNIKRSPLCGRNFEYFSEDPYLAGELASAFIDGVQSENVGACIKHFFANNQEHRRMDGSSELDERTMREIYLPAFENAVKNSKPWTVMASYNKINGTFATESKKYLKDMLRDEWGFDGLVMSDWFATHNRPGAVAAGCDLTMPEEIKTDGDIVAAVNEGRLSMEDLDNAVINVLKLAEKASQARHEEPKRLEEGDRLAAKTAAESMVLLKNDDNILPLDKSKKIAFIGEFAETPRYQGGGSSHVTSTKVTGALAAVGIDVIYAKGYTGDETEPDDALIEEAAAAAKSADVAVIFAGLPEPSETEGEDRGDMKMPESHNRLIERVCAAQPNSVVILHNGAPVETPWIDLPKAVIEAYLGGQAVGAAVCDVIFGKVNPSGRLPESFPVYLEHNPSHLFFKGEDGITRYNEGVFVGYRYYTKKKIRPRFPFGYGLSYTNFSYSNLRLSDTAIKEGGKVTVSVDVTNEGAVTGKETVLVFVSPEYKEIIRPVRELKGFDKVELSPGETKTVTITLRSGDFAYWDMTKNKWNLEEGCAAVQICKDADTVCLEKNISVML